MKMPKKLKKTLSIIAIILLGVIVALSYTLIVLVDWSKMMFNTDIDTVLFTITHPLEGADTTNIEAGFKYCIPRILVVVAIYVGIVLILHKLKNRIIFKVKIRQKVKKFNIIRFPKLIITILSIGCFLFSFMWADMKYDVIDYFKIKSENTHIYEDYYIDPETANIKYLGEKKKNLICIYLESMETTYTSTELGGKQQHNYMPNLVGLAEDNLSFSNRPGFGGFYNVTGTWNTSGALFASTSGIPYALPLDVHEMEGRKGIASGLTNMGDILEDFGYNQAFLCGSDGGFGSRKQYFEEHGNYKVMDYYWAIDQGYIDEDYYVWWGYEDKILYDIAKTEINKYYEIGEPFNFTMLTVDTHFTTGYRCDLCENEYESETANIVACADRQIKSFIDWCKQQPFYEDTVIVIQGDHTRMDKYLVSNVDTYDRMIYNCFINCDVEGVNNKNRVATSLDMFPTMMYALGFSWEGDRLGLGTNLFSNTKTLAEKMGIKVLKRELTKSSEYYKRFY